MIDYCKLKDRSVYKVCFGEMSVLERRRVFVTRR